MSYAHSSPQLRTSCKLIILLVPTLFAPTLFAPGMFAGLANQAVAQEIVLQNVKPPAVSTAVAKYGLTRADYGRIKATLPGVRRLVPSRSMPDRAVFSERDLVIDLIGTVHELPALGQVSVDHGRFLTAKNLQSKDNVAVIDSVTAKRLFPDSNSLGKNIRIGKHYYLVVGQVTDSSAPKQGKQSRGRVYIPLTTMRTRIGDLLTTQNDGSMRAEHYELSKIVIVMESLDRTQQAAEIVRTTLKKYHDTSDFSVRVMPALSSNKRK